MTHTKTLLYASLASTLILLAVLSYGFYDIRAKNKETSALLNEADVSTQSNMLAQSIRSMKNNSAGDIMLLDTSTLSDDKLVPFIELIEGVGKGMSLKTTITSVSVDKADARASAVEPAKVHVTVQTEGAWAPSIGFLHALENLPTPVAIDSTTLVANAISTGGTAKVSGTKLWKTETTITLYSFK